MFWSKIWFFVIAVLGTVALTAALITPKPAQRQRRVEESQRIVAACDAVNILMGTHARRRIDLAAQYSRSAVDVASVLGPASKKKTIDVDINKTARPKADDLIKDTKTLTPRFVVLLDNRGRVAARTGANASQYGDSLAGTDLVDDALDGYLRDDLWLIDKELFLMAASPVISNTYVGAVVTGHTLDRELAKQFVAQPGVDINFYSGGEVVASSSTVSFGDDDILAGFEKLQELDNPIDKDCRNSEPLTIILGKESYLVLLARLPGEAGEHQKAFFAVYLERAETLGLMGTLSSATSGDLSFGNFPWILVILGFIVAVAGGIALMIFETDRPLNRLNAEAISLAKGERDRMDEEGHRGKFGSVARSMNIRIDRMEREAREREAKNKSNLDDLLGPAPGPGMMGSSPSISTPKVKPPPPSEFRFSDSNPRVPALPPRPVAAAASSPDIAVSHSGLKTPPPPVPSRPDIPLEPAAQEAKKSALIANGSDGDDEVFRKVFDQFLQKKTDCRESTSNLTFERFAKKLRSNRDALMAKHSCKEVRFQVYVKDGKAALKATPIKS